MTELTMNRLAMVSGGAGALDQVKGMSTEEMANFINAMSEEERNKWMQQALSECESGATFLTAILFGIADSMRNG